MTEFDCQKLLKSLRDAQKWNLKGIKEVLLTKNAASGIAAYRQALVCNLNHWPAAFNLAACLESIGRLTAAVKWLKRCLDKENRYVPCYIALCNCYLRLGKYEEAEKMMDVGYNMME